MTTSNRREVLGRMAAAALATGSAPLVSAQLGHGGSAARVAGTPLKVSKLAATLRIVIPGSQGGGWDQTGRALGAALVGVGAADQVDYENIGGKGGTLGLAAYAGKYGSDPNALLIGGLVMVGAVVLHKPVVDLTHLQPIARLASDYLVAAVAAQSPIKTAKDLADAMHANLRGLPIAGGSAGGADHMFAGILARVCKANPADLQYQAFAGGADVVRSVATGKAVLGLSGYSEFHDAVAAGTLRTIGVSSRHAVYGVPSFRDQGVDATMDNWRGVFTGKSVAAARAAQMQAAVEAACHHEAWQRALKLHSWESSWLPGKDLVEFMKLDETMAKVLVYLLKLKAQ